MAKEVNNNKSKQINSSSSKVKEKAPIKIEKIVDEPISDRREIFAIVIGVFVVLALVFGSVIYFNSKRDPLTQKPVPKPDEIIDIIDKDDDKKEEKPKNNFVQKVNNVVKKECTTCTVVVLDTVQSKVNKDHKDYTEDKEDKVYLENNNLESKTYYKDKDNSYLIVIKGSVSTTYEDKELMDDLNKVVSYVNLVKNNEKLTDKDKEDLDKNNVASMNEKGMIVVSSKDSEYVTHAFTVRIEEKDKIDWSKGVTVNGQTYNESVLSEENEYFMQDENGINITVAVNKDDLGKDAKNEAINIDVSYTTTKNEEKTNSYELDLKNVEVKYEEKNLEEPENDILDEEALIKYEEEKQAEAETIKVAVDDILSEDV